MRLQIKRIESTPAGTYSVLVLDGEILCWGMENPTTLIPPGTYEAVRFFSPANKCEVWLLDTEEIGRSWIEVHIGNWPSDVKGCICPGERIGDLLDRRGVIDSGPAFSNLMDKTKLINLLTVEIIDGTNK